MRGVVAKFNFLFRSTKGLILVAIALIALATAFFGTLSGPLRAWGVTDLVVDIFGLRLVEAIARVAVRRDLAPDGVVLLEGEPSAGLGIIEEGFLKGVRIAPSGREQILSVFRPGEVFNAASVFAEAPNPATVIALEAATVWFVPREALLALMDRYPALTRTIVRGLSERVLQLVDLVEDLSLRTVEMRLARVLLERAPDEVLHRDPWATQAEMAARLGTVTYVLNRALRGFEEEGLISVKRHRIEILDREGLEARAECK
jgi:CRP/FNR family transcriptional regulator